MPSFTLRSRGAFSLAAAARFAEGFPGAEVDRRGEELRFAWAIDGDWRTVQVHLREADGVVQGKVVGDHSPDVVELARRDVRRILCLDVDGAGFAALGDHDPVVGALLRRFPGLRPVLFHTPYEAAAWAVIGQRIRMTQAASIKQRLARELGELGAFPSPERLAALDRPQRGLTDRKVHQLRELAAAALDGLLLREHLAALPLAEAGEQLRQLPGIGPFSAELILIRGVGDRDALPAHEPRLVHAFRAAYDLSDDVDLTAAADAWRPYRGWVAFLLRAWYEAETSRS